MCSFMRWFARGIESPFAKLFSLSSRPLSADYLNLQNQECRDRRRIYGSVTQEFFAKQRSYGGERSSGTRGCDHASGA
jgi:hypothetical protein